MRFLHISDRHWRSHKEDNAANLLLQEILDERFRGHYIIETGDITDDGHKAQYEHVQEAMESWMGKWIFCPGNHDYGWAGNFYEPERAVRFDKMLTIPFGQPGTFSKVVENQVEDPVVTTIKDETATVMLIALNSNLATVWPFDFACGMIGFEQLLKLDGILGNADPDAVKIIFFHHHPWTHGHPFMRLKDAEDLLSCIYKRVDVVLFGHMHKHAQWKSRCGIPWAVAAPSSPEWKYVNEIVVVNKTIAVRTVAL